MRNHLIAWCFVVVAASCGGEPPARTRDVEASSPAEGDRVPERDVCDRWESCCKAGMAVLDAECKPHQLEPRTTHACQAGFEGLRQIFEAKSLELPVQCRDETE